MNPIFRGSALFTLVALALAFYFGGPTGLLVAAILGAMEVSLSFDNAVVNAGVLATMNERWQRRFLTWGMIIAVFGMRVIFPLVIVSVISGLGMVDVAMMAWQDPVTYAHHLHQSHISISAFGGMFLLLVFLNFLIDEGKEVHWLAPLEARLCKLGRLESISAMLAAGVLLVACHFVPAAHQLEAMRAGCAGIVLYLAISGLSGLFDGPGTAAKAGWASFLYLEILDASFSFDGVIGAFAITKDVLTIALGLAIGAMFVRSLTIFLVRKGTLAEFIYLEHGAHYGIGSLAVLMLLSMFMPVSEVVTGLTGVGFIGLSLLSSVRERQVAHA